MSLVDGFERSAAASFCLGENAHSYTKRTLGSCLAACRVKASCSCVAFRDAPGGDQNCRWVSSDEWLGLGRSKVSFTAYVRQGATPRSSQPSKTVDATPTPRSSCGPGSGLSLQPATSGSRTPSFFLYASSLDVRALAACYERRTHRVWNSSSDAGAWIFSALQQHPARVNSSADAEVLFIPALAHLSEAAGSCGGVSHFDRMMAVAKALRAESAFQQRPHDHLLVNGVECTCHPTAGD